MTLWGGLVSGFASVKDADRLYNIFIFCLWEVIGIFCVLWGFKNCMLKSYSLLMAAQKYLFEMQNEYVS